MKLTNHLIPLLAALCPLAAHAEPELTYNGITYVVNWGWKLTPVSFESTPTGALVFPEKVEQGGKTYYVTGSSALCQGNTSITSVTFPASIESIPANAFKGCTNLSEVIFAPARADISLTPRSTPNFSNSAFMGTGIKSLTVPSYFSATGANFVFMNCKELETAVLEEGVVYCYGWFVNNTKLKDLYLPNTLTTFDSQPYTGYSNQGCLALEKLTLPYQITTVKALTYDTNYALKTINICSPTMAPNSNASAFTNKIKNLSLYVMPGTKADYLAETTWKNVLSATTLNDWGNQNNRNNRIFEAVNAEETGLAFEYDALHATAAVTGLADDAARSAAVTVPAAVVYDHRIYQVTSVADGAFKDNTTLTTLLLPHTMESVGANAFAGCSSLAQIYCGAVDAPALGANALQGVAANCTLAVPFQNKQSYSTWGIADVKVGTDPETSQLVYEFALDDETGATINHCYNISLTTGPLELPDFVCANDKFYPLTSIGSYYSSTYRRNVGAFNSCYAITSVVVPQTTTNWADGAFSGCTNLKQANIPENMEAIPQSALSNCGLTSVTLPEGLKSIGASAFSQNKYLESVIIPEGCLNLAGGIFSQCSILKEVKLPSGITSIPQSLFSLCYDLQSVEIPAGVTTIGENAFSYCESIKELQLPDGLTSLGKYAFANTYALESITIPAGITSYPEAMLAGSGITSFTIGENVTEIGLRAFGDCKKLENVYLESATPPTFVEPTSMASHYAQFAHDTNVMFFAPEGSEDAYLEADGWKELFGEPDTGNILVQDYASTGYTYDFDEDAATLTGFGEANSEAIIMAAPRAVTKDGKLYHVTAVAPDAFAGNDKIIAAILLVDVTSVGAGAFSGCTALEGLNLPANVAEVGNDAFTGCSAMAELTLNEELATIGDGAFADCTSLTNLILPESVTALGAGAFGGCTGLEQVICQNTVPPTFGTDAFRSLENCMFIVPAGYEEEYASAPGWKEFFDNTTNYINDAVDASNTDFYFDYDDAAMTAVIYGYKGSTADVIVPAKVMNDNKTYAVIGIDDSAFYQNDEIESVTLPEGIKSIGEAAFVFCQSLSSINLPSSLESIGMMAFCVTSIQSIDIPESVTEIGLLAFAGMPYLEQVTVNTPEPLELPEDPDYGGVFLSDLLAEEGIEQTPVADCKLIVPEGSKDAYAAAPQWQDFEITPKTPTGIESVIFEESSADGVWTISGLRVESVDNLAPGLYIIRSNGTTQKVLVK